jgi:tripartite-type tricarboxylate transporter receptor subunit TctC
MMFWSHHLRPRMLAAMMALAALAMTATGAAAQDYPNRTIRIICIHPVGITSDIIARALAQKLNEALGQPVIVENRPGANGIVAANMVAKAEPDGYTMLITSGSHVANAHVGKDIAYHPINDFAPITHLTSSYGLALITNLPVNSVAELVELAKKKPGQLSYATNGAGNITHIAGLLMEQRAGIKMIAVPYNTPNMVTDVIAGTVDMMFVGTVNAEPLVNGKQVKALAVTGPRRAVGLPDTPTLQELGYKDFDVTGYFGLLFPANTPGDRVEKIQREVTKALNSPTLKNVMQTAGMYVVGSTPDEFTAFLKKDNEHQDRLMREVGLK